MNRKMGKVDEAVDILVSMGLPRPQQNERSGLTLLALLDLREDTDWSDSKKRLIRIHDIIVFIQKNYGRQYAENTRETIRRQTIHQFEQAGIAVRNPENALRPTNSPNTVYAIADEALKTIQQYGSSAWASALAEFAKNKGKLVERYEKHKKTNLISVQLPEGTPISFSPGKHNELQVKIIQEFRRRFCPNTRVVYIGDTAKKLLHVEKELLERLKIPLTKHDKLPDVILYDPEKNHLFLIEAVTAHGPLSPKRQVELEEILKDSGTKRIYVSAFRDFREFKRHIDNIAWDTEVWIASNLDHMIHFNGPKFFNVYGA